MVHERSLGMARCHGLRAILYTAVVSTLLSGFGGAPAHAQELDEDYVLNVLLPAALDMQSAGVNGDASSIPTAIQILENHGIPTELTAAEAQYLVSAIGYARRQETATFRFAQAAENCAELRQKADLAQRLERTLANVALLNGIAAGLTWVLPPAAGAFGLAALTTGAMATWARWTFQDLTQRVSTVCEIGGGPTWFLPVPRFRLAADWRQWSFGAWCS